MTIGAVQALCSRIHWCPAAVLESCLELALEIAREGREGRRIGTLFTIGRADEVVAASRALILDPLAGHAPTRTHITDPNLRGTMKELAQLDGAFVISETGIVVAACRVDCTGCAPEGIAMVQQRDHAALVGNREPQTVDVARLQGLRRKVGEVPR